MDVICRYVLQDSPQPKAGTLGADYPAIDFSGVGTGTSDIVKFAYTSCTGAKASIGRCGIATGERYGAVATCVPQLCQRTRTAHCNLKHGCLLNAVTCLRAKIVKTRTRRRPSPLGVGSLHSKRLPPFAHGSFSGGRHSANQSSLRLGLLTHFLNDDLLAVLNVLGGRHNDCFGVTRDNVGFEPRRSTGPLRQAASAHELWVVDRSTLSSGASSDASHASARQAGLSSPVAAASAGAPVVNSENSHEYVQIAIVRALTACVSVQC